MAEIEQYPHSTFTYQEHENFPSDPHSNHRFFLEPETSAKQRKQLQPEKGKTRKSEL